MNRVHWILISGEHSLVFPICRSTAQTPNPKTLSPQPNTNSLQQSTPHLTHPSNTWNNSVVEEIKLFSCFAEEKVNFIIITHCVAFWEALLDEGRAYKSWVCGKNKPKYYNKKPKYSSNVEHNSSADYSCWNFIFILMSVWKWTIAHTCRNILILFLQTHFCKSICSIL